MPPPISPVRRSTWTAATRRWCSGPDDAPPAAPCAGLRGDETSGPSRRENGSQDGNGLTGASIEEAAACTEPHRRYSLTACPVGIGTCFKLLSGGLTARS